ncbi:MAG: hypothetical protein M3P98_00140 [bacterium]|nr:hypothetical protein [bacterium]
MCKSDTVLTQVITGTTYAGYAKRLIYQMKFVPDRTAALLVAKWLDGIVSALDVDVVTWVPTANKRVRERGFDHSKLIAKHFAELRSLPVDELLYRMGKARQVGSQKLTRRQQIRGVFLPSKPIYQQKVLIIDDIVTTGATLNEATKILKQAGASKVTSLTFAQSVSN